MNELLDEMLQCSLCLEQQDDPRLLPCHHSYCRNCLHKFVTSKEQANKVCPMCRAEFVVPEGGVEKFTQNFLVNQILDARDKVRKQSEDECHGTAVGGDVLCHVEECHQPSVTYCGHGCGYLCIRCDRQHTRMPLSKRHQTVPAGQAASLQDRGLDTPLAMCTKHNHQYLDLYCKDCQEVTCATCFVLCHRDHNCCEISAFVDTMKTELTSILGEADHCLTAVQQARHDLHNQLENQIEMDGNKLKQKMTIAFHAMHDQLDSEEARVNSQIEDAISSVKKAIVKECHSQEILEANLQSVRSSIEKLLKDGSTQEFAASVASLKELVPEHFALQLQKFKWQVQERWVNWKIPIGAVTVHKVKETIGKTNLFCMNEKDAMGVCGLVTVSTYVLVLFRRGNIFVCSTPSGIIKEISPFASCGVYTSLSLLSFNSRLYLVTLALDHNLCVKREVVAQKDEVMFGGLWQYQLTYPGRNMTSDSEGHLLITDPAHRSVHVHQGASLQELKVITLSPGIIPQVVYNTGETNMILDSANSTITWMETSSGRIQRQMAVPAGVTCAQLTSSGDVIVCGEHGLCIVRSEGEAEVILDAGIDNVHLPHQVYLDASSSRLYVAHYSSTKKTISAVSYLSYQPCMVTTVTLQADIPGITN